MKARFKIFGSAFKAWEETGEKVAAFLEKVGPERLISVAHTSDPSIIVWYWEEDASDPRPAPRDRPQ